MGSEPTGCIMHQSNSQRGCRSRIQHRGRHCHHGPSDTTAVMPQDESQETGYVSCNVYDRIFVRIPLLLCGFRALMELLKALVSRV